MARFELGAAWVDVHADTDSLGPEVRAATDRATRNSRIRVKVEVDDSSVRDSERHVSRLSNMFLDTFRNITNAAQQAASQVGAALAGAVATTVSTGGVNILVGALVALGIAAATAATSLFALAPVVALVAGGFGAAITGAFGLASAIGVVRLAFSGVSEALKAHSAMQDQVGRSGARLASQERSNAVAVRNAQESIGDARRRAAQVAEDSARRIRNAQEGLARAREAAAERIKNAEDRLRDVNERAQESLARLNEERENAKKRIEDLADAARDAALSEERAALRVAEAKERLQIVESHLAMGTGQYTDLDRQKALLDLKEATYDLADAQEASIEKQRKATEAARDGVEGDRRVIEAKKAADKAARDQAEAQADLAKVQRDAARQIADAERNVLDARRDSARAQADANRAVERATRALSDLRAQQAEQTKAQGAQNAATLKYRQALDQLSPAGRAFVEQVIRMKDRLDDLRKTAESTMLPGVVSFLRSSEKLFPVVNAHVARAGAIFGSMFSQIGGYIESPLFRSQLSNILGAVERGFEHVSRAVLALLPALVSIGEAAAPIFESIMKSVGDAAENFGKWIEAKRKSGELQTFFEQVKETLSKIKTTGALLIGIIGELIKTLFPSSKSFGDDWLGGFNEGLRRLKDWLADPENKQEIRDFLAKTKEVAIQIGNAYLAVADFIESLGKLGAKIKETQEKVKKFNDASTDAMAGVLLIFIGNLDKIKAAWNTTFEWIKKKLGDWMGGIRSTATDALNSVRGSFTSAVSSVKNTWDAGLKWVHDRANSWFGQIKNLVTGLKNHFVSVFDSIGNALVGPLNKVIDVANSMIGKVNVILPRDIPLIGKIAVKKAEGGLLTGPGTGTSDDIPVMASNGEYVIRAAAVRRLGVGLLDRLNHADRLDIAGDTDTMRVRPRYASGGLISRTQNFIRSVDPLPYIWAAVGPNGYDCSGLVGEVWARLTGNKSYRRYFTTHNITDGFGFRPGRGTYTIGLSPGHVVGNLAGLAFEAASTRTGIKVGSSAKSVNAMARQYYLPQVGGEFIDGGGGHGGIFNPSAIIGRILDVLVAPFNRTLDNWAGQGIIPHIVKGIFGNFPSQLKDKAVSLFDSGGVLPPGLTMALNNTGRNEQVLSPQDLDALKYGAGRGGDTYHISVSIPVRALDEVRTVTDFIDRIQSTARQYGARTPAMAR